jgi:hypothetical protein
MSRLNITFPWVFNSLSGVQPSSDLDDDYNAVPQGDVTIRAKVLAASTVLTTDDEYSFFLCVPTNNMTITPPASVNPNYSFFVSNQSSLKTVQLIAPFTIDGVPVLNPTLPGDFGSLLDVIGGLAINDGSTWSLYPQLFMEMPSIPSTRTLWNYKVKTTATSGYPGDGNMLYNNATQISATALLLAHLTSDGFDIDLFLAFIASGNTIIIQDANVSGNFQKWTVSGSPTNTNPNTSTSYWTVPVTLVSSGGTGTTGFANNHQLLVVLFQ